MELSQARVGHHLVVPAFAETPTRLDLSDGPHLVNVLGKLVPDVLHERGKLNLKQKFIGLSRL